MSPREPAALPILAILLLPVSLPGAQEHEHHGLPLRADRHGEEDSSRDVDVSVIEWGDWSVALDGLEELGASLSVDVIADSSWPLAGGLRHRRTDRALVDAALEVDLEHLAGLDDTLFFVEAYSLAGRDASDDVGDIQAFSNIDGEHVTQLAELWLEHTLPGGDLRLKAGKVDANSEFAHVDAGLGFLHSSAGFSPTIFALPTYPDPAVSLNAFARPSPDWHVGLGLYNAQDGGTVSGRRGMSADFDAAFLIGQVERHWSGGEGGLAVGLWHHTGDFERFDGRTESGTNGAFALFEQRLFRERPSVPVDDGSDARSATQGLTGFLQWGVADGELSEFEAHLGAGLLYTGLVPQRDSWETGLYLSHADLTNDPAAGLGGTELAIELFQELRLTPSLTVKPDLQFIVDPSGADDVDDVWVATLRVELSL